MTQCEFREFGQKQNLASPQLALKKSTVSSDLIRNIKTIIIIASFGTFVDVFVQFRILRISLFLCNSSPISTVLFSIAIHTAYSTTSIMPLVNSSFISWFCTLAVTVTALICFSTKLDLILLIQNNKKNLHINLWF